MIWFKRLFYLPLLIKLHWDHSVLVVKIHEMQKTLFKIIEQYGYKNAGMCQKRLEELLEEMTDLDERILKLWRSGSDSKKG